jgi:autotransporter passenger strand-loop-strand repeat protein
VSTTVSSGETVSITQSDSGATVQGGGILIIDGGGTETSATINPGGVETVASGGTDFGATVGSGGSELVMAGGTASDAVIGGGTLEIADGGTLAGAVDFAGSGTLQIDGAAMPAATISGFGVGQTIDLAGVAYDGAGSATLAAGNVLQVSEGGQTYSLDLDPTQNYAGHGFALASDGHGGTTIVDPQSTFTVANETDLDTAIRSIDVGGSNVGLSAYTININTAINPTGDLPTIQSDQRSAGDQPAARFIGRKKPVPADPWWRRCDRRRQWGRPWRLSRLLRLCRQRHDRKPEDPEHGRAGRRRGRADGQRRVWRRRRGRARRRVVRRRAQRRQQ